MTTTTETLHAQVTAAERAAAEARQALADQEALDAARVNELAQAHDDRVAAQARADAMAHVRAEAEAAMSARENAVSKREREVAAREQAVKQMNAEVLSRQASFLMMEENVKAWAAAGAPKIAG
jgi:hypothetical protein